MTLERLEVTPFSLVVAEILQSRRTGHLTVITPAVRRVLYWSSGELVMGLSEAAGESLGDFLSNCGAIPSAAAAGLTAGDPACAVARLQESGLLEPAPRQALLREWLSALFLPLFAATEGTAAFSDDDALPPENRVFLHSTAALVIEGVRFIDNGLVLRRSLGDLRRTLRFARDAAPSVDDLPLTDQERAIAVSLSPGETIDAFLKRFGSQSGVAAKVVIALLTTGTLEAAETRDAEAAGLSAETARDLEILASIGSNDTRSLHAVSFSRQLESLDHYQTLRIPRSATRHQVETAAEQLRREYDPATFPPAVRDVTARIRGRIDEAVGVLSDASRRSAYDRLLGSMSHEGATPIQQRLTQKTIARQNLKRAKELSAEGDYYGAIVLLQQAVKFDPDDVETWHLLGACQERNPRWRRRAAESYQEALAIDPENTELLISLGDLYLAEGMSRRAEACYADVLMIQPGHPQAKSRLEALRRR